MYSISRSVETEEDVWELESVESDKKQWDPGWKQGEEYLK